MIKNKTDFDQIRSYIYNTLNNHILNNHNEGHIVKKIYNNIFFIVTYTSLKLQAFHILYRYAFLA